MTDATIIQRSPEWFAARLGSLGASQLADALAKTKSGWGASRSNLQTKLVLERLTGRQEENFSSTAMQWGVDKEDDARTAYSFFTGREVTEVGLYKHPTIVGSHASPDGLVAHDGCLEIKCPNSLAHIEVLKTNKIAHRYLLQMQWQMKTPLANRLLRALPSCDLPKEVRTLLCGLRELIGFQLLHCVDVQSE